MSCPLMVTFPILSNGWAGIAVCEAAKLSNVSWDYSLEDGGRLVKLTNNLVDCVEDASLLSRLELFNSYNK